MTELATKQTRGRPPISDGRAFDDLTLDKQIERWERLTKVLREMSDHAIDHHFDMNTWMSVTSCGTVGCAAGQCALDPWFRRRGFGINIFKASGAWSWSGLYPEQFFGIDGYNEVLTDSDIMMTDKFGERRDRKPRAQHRLALRAANQYLKSLKAQR